MSKVPTFWNLIQVEWDLKRQKHPDSTTAIQKFLLIVQQNLIEFEVQRVSILIQSTRKIVKTKEMVEPTTNKLQQIIKTKKPKIKQI